MFFTSNVFVWYSSRKSFRFVALPSVSFHFLFDVTPITFWLNSTCTIAPLDTDSKVESLSLTTINKMRITVVRTVAEDCQTDTADPIVWRSFVFSKQVTTRTLGDYNDDDDDKKPTVDGKNKKFFFCKKTIDNYTQEEPNSKWTRYHLFLNSSC